MIATITDTRGPRPWGFPSSLAMSADSMLVATGQRRRHVRLGVSPTSVGVRGWRRLGGVGRGRCVRTEGPRVCGGNRRGVCGPASAAGCGVGCGARSSRSRGPAPGTGERPCSWSRRLLFPRYGDHAGTLSLSVSVCPRRRVLSRRHSGDHDTTLGERKRSAAGCHGCVDHRRRAASPV